MRYKSGTEAAAQNLHRAFHFYLVEDPDVWGTSIEQRSFVGLLSQYYFSILVMPEFTWYLKLRYCIRVPRTQAKVLLSNNSGRIVHLIETLSD